MEVPKSVKNRINHIQDPNSAKPGPKLDFARNLSFWQKYLSQKKSETRNDVSSTRELAEHKGHRKSTSNNFSMGHSVAVRPTKTTHIRSITSYHAVLDPKAKASNEEIDADELKTHKEQRNQLSNTGKMKNHVSLGSNFTKPQSSKKMAPNGNKKTVQKPKQASTANTVDFFKKPKLTPNIETKRPRIVSENFKSFGESKKPPISVGIDRLKAFSKEFKHALKSELVINNNINIQPNNSAKENNFSGNIKISIDFYDSKNSNKDDKTCFHKKQASKDGSVPNLYEKKTSVNGKAGFFSKKNSIVQLDDLTISKDNDLAKVKSNCVSPTYHYYHKRMASETGAQAKKLVFNLNIDMRKQGTNQSNKPIRQKTSLNNKLEAKKKLDAFNKNTISTKRHNKMTAGHRRNVLSLPGTSLSSFLTNLRVPVQLDNKKSVSMTPDLSANKEKKVTKKKGIAKLRVSTSHSKKLIVSYSRISEEDNEDGAVESKSNSIVEKLDIKEESKDTIKSSDMSLQSYISRSSDDEKPGSGFKELCNSDKTYLYKLNTNSSTQRKLLIAKIIEEGKLSDEVPPTGLEYYHIEKLLGEGSYGKVYKATSVLSSAPVAIKCYERSKIKSETACRRIMQEIEILKYTCHPHIIRLYEIFENQKYIFMVIEYVDSGDLLNYLRRKGVFEESNFLVIFKQVIRALHYLHFNGILHRDVKLDNILIDSSGQVKICDFGVSRKMPKSELVHEHIGTPAYLAPEIVANKGYKGFQADVWSLGVMTYIALTGQVPFKGNKIEELHDSILNHEVTFDDDCGLSSLMQSVIRGMLEKDPKKRLNFNEIAERFNFRIGGFERLETEFTNKEKIARIRGMGYTDEQIDETLEKEDINHIYALYRLMDSAKSN